MTDKQDALSGGFRLPGWEVVEAAGADAAAFLQGQTMNDVRALAAGHWQWNGWLTPKGRLVALFALVALEADRYWLVLPDFPAAELAGRLQRFVFRSKVKLRVRGECVALGAFAARAQARGAAIRHVLVPDRESVELDFGADGGARMLCIASGLLPGDGSNPAGIDTDAVQKWNACDLAHGLPRLPIGQSEAWTPQMLSLDRLGAYSLKKGCYPGQEIVARTHYLGQAKRNLARVHGTGIAVGDTVHAGERELGTVVSVVGDEALAVLAADRPESGWSCQGKTCDARLLLGGLAR